MKHIFKQFSVSIATAALLLNAAGPALAETNIVISGNGSYTNNDANVTQFRQTTSQQSNVTEIENDFDIDLDSGHNSSNGNTGGNLMMTTGNSIVDLDVTNLVNTNVSQIEGCGTCEGDATVSIKGNGTRSDNDATATLVNTVWVNQNNVADIENDVDIDADSGWNSMNDSTGADSAVMHTGTIGVDFSIANIANANTARVGGGSDDGRDVSLHILDNGSYTNNDIVLGLTDSITVFQNNVSDVENDLDINGDTGHNYINNGTGGDILLTTGAFAVLGSIDNMTNFNAATVDCDDCLLDITAKVVGNGTRSDSDINAALNGVTYVDQSNSCGGMFPFPTNNRLGFFMFPWFDFDDECLENDIDINGGSGWNYVNDTTGESDSDPAIHTGSTGVAIDVDNSSGINVYGASVPALSLNWNMAQVWTSVLGMWH